VSAGLKRRLEEEIRVGGGKGEGGAAGVDLLLGEVTQQDEVALLHL
jgi:hypothetical protein